MHTERIRLDAHQRRALSVAAMVDPRTVVRYLAGLPIRSTCAARIREALQRLKLGPISDESVAR
jgi:hypothetical protein